MADNNILKAGGDNNTCPPTKPEIDVSDFLRKSNYFSEFENELDIVLENLGVYSKEDTYNKEQVKDAILDIAEKVLEEHLDEKNPHGINTLIEEAVKNFVKDDGSTPFKSAQKGQRPILEDHLTTKKYVDDEVKAHVDGDDPHGTYDKIKQELKSDYVNKEDAVDPCSIYYKDDINKFNKEFVKRDGSVGFLRPVKGITPTNSLHLATKDYVDTVMSKHNTANDPHNLLVEIASELAGYAKKQDVYIKDDVYNKQEIDNNILLTVAGISEEFLKKHLREKDPHNIIPKVDDKLKNYVKKDGSTPFTAPQVGVPAEKDDHLITKKQVEEAIEKFNGDVNDSVKWLTSGPVDITVGYVNENDELPDELTFQETMDAIFYGRMVEIYSSVFGLYNQLVDVTITIHGTMGLIDIVELYQNDELLGTYTKEDFTDSQKVVESNPITEDTVFKVIVTYTNGSKASDTSTTSIFYATYTGIIPKFKVGSTISYQYILDQVSMDPTNNILHSADGPEVTEIKHKFDFYESGELKKLVVATPMEYPSLESIYLGSQQFGVDAFEVVTDLPFSIGGLDKEVMYKVYIYYIPITKFSSEITFKFENNNE